MAKRKNVVLNITVSVPASMSVVQTKVEVRTLINEQCNFAAEEGEVKVKKISSCKRTIINGATSV